MAEPIYMAEGWKRCTKFIYQVFAPINKDQQKDSKLGKMTIFASTEQAASFLIRILDNIG